MQDSPSIVKQALHQEYQEIAGKSDSFEHLQAKIGKILCDHGFPAAYLVVFADNAQRLQSIVQRCSQGADPFRPDFKLQKTTRKNPL